MTHTWVGIVAAIVGLGIMILIHEWGHFVAAKLCGVRVEVFSIGFGTRIFGWRRGDTDYRLSVLPLGGYVRMAGDNPAEERTGAPDEFLSRPRWQRLIIALAGPLMNLVLAFVLLWGLYVVGMNVPAYTRQPAVVSEVLADSPAAKAGIRPGDQITAIAGSKIATWNDVLTNASVMPGHNVSLTLERAGVPVNVSVSVPTNLFDPYSVTGYPPVRRVLVDSVESGLPAAKEGLRAGDEILSAAGIDHPNPALLSAMIRHSDGKPVEMRILRRGKDISLVVKPVFEDPGDGGGKRWVIGAMFEPGDLIRESLPVMQAASQSLNENASMFMQILQVVGGLFSGRFSLKELAGPIGIVRMSDQAAQMGATEFITFMAFLSVDLGILNLLPIPILDGGHILMLGIEGSLRRDLSLRFKERFVQVGLVFLLAIFGFVMYYDILRLFPGH